MLGATGEENADTVTLLQAVLREVQGVEDRLGVRLGDGDSELHG